MPSGVNNTSEHCRPGVTTTAVAVSQSDRSMNANDMIGALHHPKGNVTNSTALSYVRAGTRHLVLRSRCEYVAYPPRDNRRPNLVVRLAILGSENGTSTRYPGSHDYVGEI